MAQSAYYQSHERIESIWNEVLEEYGEHGLLTRGVWHTPLVTTWTDAHIGFAYGLYMIETWGSDSFWGYKRGHIYVPRGSFVGALNRIGRQRVNLRDTLRHELAHALAYTGRGLIRGWRNFRGAFGAHHDDEWEAAGPPLPRSAFVTSYATTSPAEDFAESVMCYLRYQGKLARYRRRPALRAKMELVARLPGRIKRMGLGA